MEGFISIDERNLELINGGDVNLVDVATGIAGCIFPPFGVFWAIETASDWVYQQDL